MKAKKMILTVCCDSICGRREARKERKGGPVSSVSSHSSLRFTLIVLEPVEDLHLSSIFVAGLVEGLIVQTE